MAIRKNGRGNTALKKLCSFFNLPEPPHVTAVSDLQKNIFDA